MVDCTMVYCCSSGERKGLQYKQTTIQPYMYFRNRLQKNKACMDAKDVHQDAKDVHQDTKVHLEGRLPGHCSVGCSGHCPHSYQLVMRGYAFDPK